MFIRLTISTTNQWNRVPYLNFLSFQLRYFDSNSLQITSNNKSNIVFEIDRGKVLHSQFFGYKMLFLVVFCLQQNSNTVPNRSSIWLVRRSVDDIWSENRRRISENSRRKCHKRVRGRPFNSWGVAWVISDHQEFFF